VLGCQQSFANDLERAMRFGRWVTLLLEHEGEVMTCVMARSPKWGGSISFIRIVGEAVTGNRKGGTEIQCINLR
jgi:hypothetical protein